MKELIATENNWLTQKNVDNEENRFFVKKVLTPNVNLWVETTDYNKQEWESKYNIDEVIEN